MADRASNVEEFTEARANSYDREVGERGNALSVGQGQRIAIARAILRNPAVLILDEAMSAQDTESSLFLEDSVSKFMRQRTILMISHRNAMKRADRILVLDQGTVVAQGNHNALMQESELYSRLFSAGGAA